METQIGILLVFGIGVFGGVLSSLLAKRLSVPQVLGYIVAGIVIGESGLQVVTRQTVELLRPFNLFALGVIGFLVGSELKYSTFQKYAKQFAWILLCEGIFAFILVGTAATCIVYFLVYPSVTAALAAGIVFGAIASATDPASTIDVLWEYRTAGRLTTTLTAIVALDDALAMTLYGLGTGAARFLSGGRVSWAAQAGRIAFELLGSILLGLLCGLVLWVLLRRALRTEQVLAAAVGILLLCIGLAAALDMDVILASMAMGVLTINIAPHRSKRLVELVRSLSTPLYVLFFVLVGARLSLHNMPWWLWLIVGAYVGGRSTGKCFGAWLGATISNAAPEVRKYTGLGLFAQGGVAIGLSIMATQHLRNVELAPGLYLGDVIIFGVTATTFILQLSGPPLVKLAAKAAGEIGKRVTEQDVAERLTVGDVMIKTVSTVPEAAPVRQIISAFAEGGTPFFIVTDEKGRAMGTVTIEELREALVDPSCWDWLLASDVMAPLSEVVYAGQSVKDALHLLRQIHADHVPVLKEPENPIPVGLFDLREATQHIHREVVSSHADTSEEDETADDDEEEF